VELAETFVELADTGVDEFDLDDFLNLLADRCVRLLNVSAAALLLVEQGGRARATGASGERARELAQLEEGPGSDCHRAGESVVVPDLARVTLRWPEFAAAATAAGFGATHTVPLRLRTEVIGALTLFSAAPGELDKVTDRVAQSMADVATIGLLQARELRRRADLAAQLQHALTSRVVIEQAKGILAERLSVAPNQAFTALRRHARSGNHRLTDLARAIIAGTAALPDREQRRGGPATAP
jgi:GAF domain-containing protein